MSTTSNSGPKGWTREQIRSLLGKTSLSASLTAIAVGAALTLGCVSPHAEHFDRAAQSAQKLAAGCPTSVIDHDGNRYGTVLIGQQCWLAENLRVNKGVMQ